MVFDVFARKRYGLRGLASQTITFPLKNRKNHSMISKNNSKLAKTAKKNAKNHSVHEHFRKAKTYAEVFVNFMVFAVCAVFAGFAWFLHILEWVLLFLQGNVMV